MFRETLKSRLFLKHASQLFVCEIDTGVFCSYWCCLQKKKTDLGNLLNVSPQIFSVVLTASASSSTIDIMLNFKPGTS